MKLDGEHRVDAYLYLRGLWMLWWPGGTEITGPGICAAFCRGLSLGPSQPRAPEFYYHFAVQRSSKIENLGGLTMANDAEAIDFGKLVVQDLIRRDSEQHAGWTMRITERGRAVFSVDFESEGRLIQRKHG